MKAINPEYDTINAANKKVEQHIKAEFTRFLQRFEEKGQRKYVEKAEQLLITSKHIMLINTKDFYKYNNILADTVIKQYSRFQSALNAALTSFMNQIQNGVQGVGEIREKNHDEDEQALDSYEVAFDRGIQQQDLKESIRSLKCEMLGILRSIVGTVTRVSQIRPELLEGVFLCGFCGRMSQKIPQQYKYTTPKRCLGQGCDNNSVWELCNTNSVFADFQKLRVQEDSSKIPPGEMPRSIDVILRNENTQKGQPGDQIHIVGYLTVIPDITSLLKPGERTAIFTRNPNTRKQIQQGGINGIKGIKQLSYKLCLMANNIFVMNNQFNEQILTQQEAEQNEMNDKDLQDEQEMKEKMTAKIFSKLTPQQIHQIKLMKQNPRLEDDLAQSLFHEIFGHSEIKKALLLQLLGGLHKKTQNKISLRGDINVLIVGDPSTAKSQFLKCVSKFVPRSVYTNGKTTSAAGLTASVVRDDETGNVSIEAGALLLADNGICCIDEFDKMDIRDQVAIHEAMEQQTISIAKAGVQATLHARTSILAAANPIFGRYDKSQSLRKNINISPPIMSRFDLYFIICDEVNEQSDQKLSQFIVSMHKDKKQFKIQKKYSTRQLKNYISVAKKFKPRLTRQAAQDLRRYYVQLRRRDKSNQNSHYQVTVRQLESMIRLSEALAKLHLDLEIKPQYVRKAYYLLESSMVKLQKSAFELADQNGISQNQKASLGLRGLLGEKQVQKKQKKVKIGFDVMMQMQRNIIELFQQKQKRHKRDKIQDVELYLTEEDVIAYLLTINYENGDLASQAENQKAKKLYHAVINYLVKQEMLAVSEENKNQNLRKLMLHPNFDEAKYFKEKQQSEQNGQIQKRNHTKK